MKYIQTSLSGRWYAMNEQGDEGWVPSEHLKRLSDPLIQPQVQESPQIPPQSDQTMVQIEMKSKEDADTMTERPDENAITDNKSDIESKEDIDPAAIPQQSYIDTSDDDEDILRDTYLNGIETTKGGWGSVLAFEQLQREPTKHQEPTSSIPATHQVTEMETKYDIALNLTHSVIDFYSYFYIDLR